MRIGIGFDIHRLAAGDGITLGGVTIPSDKKLVGHSEIVAIGGKTVGDFTVPHLLRHERLDHCVPFRHRAYPAIGLNHDA